jgi:hypothetical protein
MEVDADAGDKPSLLTDSRFSALFEDPEFEVNERSREYALLHPSAVAMKKRAAQREESSGSEDEGDESAGDVDDVGMGGEVDGERRTKTAVEEEEEESDKAHSDTSDDDSSDAGGTFPFPFFFLVHFTHYATLQNYTQRITKRANAVNRTNASNSYPYALKVLPPPPVHKMHPSVNVAHSRNHKSHPRRVRMTSISCVTQMER